MPLRSPAAVLVLVWVVALGETGNRWGGAGRRRKGQGGRQKEESLRGGTRRSGKGACVAVVRRRRRSGIKVPVTMPLVIGA